MAGEHKVVNGLLFRLIIGIFVPILIAFVIMGGMLFLNVNVGNFHLTSIKGIWAKSLTEMGAANLKESTSSLNSLGAAIIKQKAEDVARQLEIYLTSRGYPKKITIQKLYDDPVMQELTIQKVGVTGYTSVFDNQNRLQFNPNPKLSRGFETKTIYNKLGAGFIKINDTALAGTPNGGIYRWQEPDGRFRDKYMYIAHVKGTDLLVAATTYIDEFSKPANVISSTLKKLQDTYSQQYNRRFGILMIITGAVLLVLLGVIYAYSYSVVSPIKKLSEIADRISMGDLDARIDVKATGEIGVLAQSLERMQTSVKAAIERLQKRR